VQAVVLAEIVEVDAVRVVPVVFGGNAGGEHDGEFGPLLGWAGSPSRAPRCCS